MTNTSRALLKPETIKKQKEKQNWLQFLEEEKIILLPAGNTKKN